TAGAGDGLVSSGEAFGAGSDAICFAGAAGSAGGVATATCCCGICGGVAMATWSCAGGVAAPGDVSIDRAGTPRNQSIEDRGCSTVLAGAGALACAIL